MTLPAAGLVLIVVPDEWAARALDSVLEPAGYGVVRVATGAAAEEHVRSAAPDLVLISAHLPGLKGEELCRELRQDAALTPETPIIGLTSAAATRDERLRWLRAGAWDFFGFPLDAEELVLKLAAYRRAKREVDDARGGALVDPATGLYNGSGLRRRARELVAEAERLHSALACAVFGPDSPIGTRGGERDAAAGAAIRSHVAARLRTHGRLSDTIGWWQGADFAVLAPATNASGAERLARRLVAAIEAAPREPGGSVPALEVRVGYHAMTDVHATPVSPADLLERASTALGLARAEGRGPRIRQLEAGC